MSVMTDLIGKQAKGWFDVCLAEAKKHKSFWKAHVKLELNQRKMSKMDLLTEYAKEIDRLQQMHRVTDLIPDNEGTIISNTRGEL